MHRCLTGITAIRFDRMIAAVALLESLPVISSDQAFDRIGIERHWSA